MHQPRYEKWPHAWLVAELRHKRETRAKLESELTRYRRWRRLAQRNGHREMAADFQYQLKCLEGRLLNVDSQIALLESMTLELDPTAEACE